MALVQRNEILIVGNGFDLAAGYATKYTDFLELAYKADLVDAIEMAQRGEPLPEDIMRLIREPHRISLNTVKEFKKLLGENGWALYFHECKADQQGWIDLEHEIEPVLQAFHWIISSEYSMEVLGAEGCVTYCNCPENIRRILDLWRDYFLHAGKTVIVHKKWCNPQYGLYKDRIVQDLKEDFHSFKRLLAIGMDLLTQAPPFNNPTINSLRADVILNFNYTTTERKYDNLRDAKIFHVHGSVNDPDGIVLGVNRVDSEQDRFIYWTKPFQRILTRQDPHYKEYIQGSVPVPYAVTVFGHSLDMLDAYILAPLMNKAMEITVYYHSEDEYEQKIVNMVRLLGQDEMEKRVYEKRIRFISTQG